MFMTCFVLIRSVSVRIRDHMNTALAFLWTTSNSSQSSEKCHKISICILLMSGFVQLDTIIQTRLLKTCFFTSPFFYCSLMFHSSTLIYFVCLTVACVMISQFHYLVTYIVNDRDFLIQLPICKTNKCVHVTYFLCVLCYVYACVCMCGYRQLGEVGPKMCSLTACQMVLVIWFLHICY